MKKLFLILLFSLPTFNLQAQITSTGTGGVWSDTLTWIGHIVPEKNDDVIINGTVTGTGECNNLTNNYSIKRANITVFGNLHNHGGIVDTDSGDNSGLVTKLTVYGNITNTEQINISNLYLNGDDGHVHYLTNPDTAIISISSLKNAGNNRCYLMPVGNVTLQHSVIDLGEEGKIELSDDYELSLWDCTVYYSKIYGQNMNKVNFDLGSRLVHRVKLEDVTLSGEINLGAWTEYTVKVEGTVINNGTIQDNLYGAPTLLLIQGNFVNNGTIKDNDLRSTEDYRWLRIDLETDLVNNGTWKNGLVNLTGTGNQTLFLHNEMAIDDLVITDTLGKVIAGTDLKFHDTNISGNYATLLMYGKKLYNDGENSLYRITIDNAVLEGKIDLSYDVVFTSGLVNNGRLKERSNSVYPDINCNFTNNGIVKDSTGTLFLNISGDVTNNGEWLNYSTILDGTVNQHLSFTTSFKGKYFYRTDTTSTLIVDTPIEFHNTYIDLAKNMYQVSGKMLLQENTGLTLIGDGSYYTGNLYHCDISANGNPVKLQNNSYTNYNVILRDAVLQGNFYCAYDLQLKGTTIIEDTLTNKPTGSSTVHVEGNLVNNGYVANNGSGYLSVDLYGNLDNQGTWELYKIDTKGNEDQTIKFDSDKPIRSYFYYRSNVGSSNYKWLFNGEEMNGKTYVYFVSDSVTIADAGEYQCSTNDGLSRKIIIKTSSLTASFTTDSTVVQVGDSVHFSDNTAGYITSWDWDFGDGNSSNDQNPSHVYSEPGIYSVTLVVSDGVISDTITKTNYITVKNITGIGDNEIPLSYELKQNYPNPFNPTTTIEFSIIDPGMVNISVFNLLGQNICEIVNDEFQPGRHTIEFNAASLPSGVYFYRIKTKYYSNVKKLMLLK